MGTDLLYFCDDQRHLVCTPFTVPNLHEMARDLGIDRGWFHASASFPHYDVPARRVHEVAAQCVVVRPRVVLRIARGDFLRSVEP